MIVLFKATAWIGRAVTLPEQKICKPMLCTRKLQDLLTINQYLEGKRDRRSHQILFFYHSILYPDAITSHQIRHHDIRK